MSFKTKFMISFQHSGRRWLCNVLGHYDKYLQKLEPRGTWIKNKNPLKIYGTDKRWNILPSHCNEGVGKKIIIPRLYRYRSAMILIRHPAKVIYSLFRSRKEKIPEFNISLEAFARSNILDFYILYSNIVYSCFDHKNKFFVPYSKLYMEQFSDNKDEWSRVIRFFFGTVDQEILNKAVTNNIAIDSYTDGIKRHNRAMPAELGQLTEAENLISELIKPNLSAQLKPDIYNFFVENNYT